MERIWTFAFKTRNILAAVPLIVALVAMWTEWTNDWRVWSLALALCVAGAWLRGWARCHNTFSRKREKGLAVTGPYAFSRNPLYIANMLLLASAGVALGNGWFLLLLIVWSFIVYSATIKHEEIRLTKRHGDLYRAYSSQVPAWLSLNLRRLTKKQVSMRDFLPVVSLQILYGLLLLAPVVIKKFDPFSLWS